MSRGAFTQTKFDMEIPIAVECEGVIKDFGSGSTKQRVLRGIDWQVPIGATTFLVGPSGCGKTTLISIIAGLLSATAGRVRVLGQETTKMRNGALVRFRADHLGFIFQQFNLLPSLTAVENAAVSLVARGSTLASAKRQASGLLDRLGLETNKWKYPNQLSGGQQQRVAIARALVHNPQIVICDEPTASLDAETGHEAMQLMREVASGPDRAVIVVTHDTRIFEFADYIATMSDGRIESFGKNTQSEILH
jgi:putative ABC transport system ATP-binding protein